ncbi:hypothetical protein [Halolamina salifodinae]|uniref:Uncharacterized protein n=1 Tax=Halolamina salifodinae TaxID=1202767 RepID=A0A8T4GT35_9EURY|nr:hypothetical protein [Halolamina salifodinae]MBP1986026.1 hypothetical protein [Halolamina salifodinae]
MSTEDPVAFEYQGYLLFNGIYEVSSLNSKYEGSRSEARATLSELFDSYEKGDQGTKKGYEDLDLPNYIRDDDSVEEKLSTVADFLISHRYLYEDRESTDAYYQGEEVEVEVPHVQDTDIYWYHPEYMLFRGSKDDVQEAREHTRTKFGADANLRSVDFTSNFLLWLFYKHCKDDPLYDACEFDGGLSISALTDTTLEGDRDPFGETNQVDDSTNLRRCVPMIAGILKDKNISLLEGYFQLYDDYRLKTQIGNGRVHIKASDGDIQSSNDVRRLAMSLSFLQELLQLYDCWQDLPAQERIPPYGFFEDLYETAKDLGVEIDSMSDDMLNRYGNKRDEDWLS